MKYTNKHNLPEPLKLLLIKLSSQYDKGESDITATGLIEPVQMHYLKDKHHNDITVDVSELIHSAVGTSIHSMLEECGNELKQCGFIVEERFYITLDGTKVGAKVDLFDTNTGTLWDYKNTSVYSVKGGAKEEYAQQLNIGAECLRQNGHEVKHLKIAAILRDWTKGKSNTDTFGDYPDVQYKELDVALIDSKEVLTFISERVKLHKDAKEKNIIPECSAIERWAREDSWAVFSDDNTKKAKRVCNSKDAARLFVGDKANFNIQFRPGMSTRCEDYCPVKSFCSQYKKMHEDKE